jgi:hypothetical protein
LRIALFFVSESPPEIRHAKLRDLWLYWAAKKGPGLPGRAAIQPEEMRDFLGHLLLMDVVEGGADFRYRLHGTSLISLFGGDLTGQLVSSLVVEGVTDLLDEARRVVSSRAHYYLEETVIAEKRHLRVSKLILPLAANGRDVDMLLVGIFPIG